LKKAIPEGNQESIEVKKENENIDDKREIPIVLSDFFGKKTVREIISIITFVLALLVVVYTFNIKDQTENLLERYRVADCSMHRVFEYIKNGSPQANIISEE